MYTALLSPIAVSSRKEQHVTSPVTFLVTRGCKTSYPKKVILHLVDFFTYAFF